MKALVKTRGREPGIWHDRRVDVPKVGHNDVLIRIKQDRDLRHRHPHLELGRLGAEDHPGAHGGRPRIFVGEIVEIGSEVRGFKVGDRVSGEGHITCGYCRNCRAGRRHLCRNTVGVGVNRQGAFAEYLAIPAFNVVQDPGRHLGRSGLDLRSVRQRGAHGAVASTSLGEDVLITGAGPIGIMAAAIARHVGARHVVITDVNDYRLELARKMGATRAVNVAKREARRT